MQREKIGRRGTTNAGLEPYPDYKPSGVEWLGDTPAHWGMRRLKLNAENVVRQTRGRRHEEIYIALEHVESWTGKIRKADSDVDFDSQVKQFREGDVLFGKLRPYLAKVARPAGSGVCVGEFLVLRPHADNLLPGYLEQLLRSKPIIDVIDASTFGAKMPRADWRFIGNLALPLPTLAEQAAIARYLDNVTGRIRRCIDARERLIGLLEEKRRAVIHRAVTRGLDPNVRLKPSGVEWLGDVPAHWEVLALKRLGWFRSGTGFPVGEQAQQNLELPFFKVSDMNLPNNNRVMTIWNNSISRNTAARLGATIFPSRTIIFPKVGGALLTNKRRVVECPCCIDNNLMGYIVRHGNPQFVLLLLTQLDLATIVKPGPVPAISESEIREIRIASPPFAEQAAIAAHLDKATAALDAAVACAHRQIELLREYRARLIADVVTGKLDVRKAAANLPDESGESVVLP